jgi:nucleotide-binding universal stress UspA family protein
MYKNVFIPTDGSDLAGKAVQQGINLAKYLGAKVTARFESDELYCTAFRPTKG